MQLNHGSLPQVNMLIICQLVRQNANILPESCWKESVRPPLDYCSC